MRIGVLREVKQDERRVALLPEQVRSLAMQGHDVYVEEGAGEGAGVEDSDYEAHRATVTGKAAVLENCELLLKVKAPLPSEYDDYGPQHTLFTYLHFDENIAARDITRLIGSGFLGLAYEWVGGDEGYPLLLPMSRLTGYLFAQKALELAAREKGLFCAGNETFLPGGRALIVGLGNIGLSAFRYLSDLKVGLIVVANSDDAEVNRRANLRFQTSQVDYLKDARAELIRMDMGSPQKTKDRIASYLPKVDIIINCAVRRPGLEKHVMDYLIDRQMIHSMEPGSVVCDATANDRDLIETCVSSPLLHETYRDGEVVHYNCDHIPSLVPRTATKLLTEQTFPYIAEIANRGVTGALRADRRLRNGASCYQGQMTHRLSADKKGLPFTPIESFLAERAQLAS